MTVQAILELIRRRFPTGIDGLTVSGGEPFDQPEELGNLLRMVKKMSLHTLVYTGYPYHSIAGRYPDILREIDVLIDGPYQQRIPPRHIWAGSGNQRVLRLVEGQILYEEQNSESLFLQGEITITGDGGIISTGFIKEEQ
jgi:anaerobic ribonucleoside-triphosphate reductase activating protein